MSTIDKQRIAAVRLLEAMGYTFSGSEWVPPSNGGPLASVPAKGDDAMHVLLVKRADELANCTEGAIEEWELAAVSTAIEAFEEMWDTDQG
jgi:hypothetical protein